MRTATPCGTFWCVRAGQILLRPLTRSSILRPSTPLTASSTLSEPNAQALACHAVGLEEHVTHALRQILKAKPPSSRCWDLLFQSVRRGGQSVALCQQAEGRAPKASITQPFITPCTDGKAQYITRFTSRMLKKDNKLVDGHLGLAGHSLVAGTLPNAVSAYVSSASTLRAAQRTQRPLKWLASPVCARASCLCSRSALARSTRCNRTSHSPPLD